jgi:lipopolysaccharide heptosyltransferase II
MSQAADWGSCRNVLCVRLDAMGDVLMTTPAVRALKESVPGRRITLLTSPSGAAVAALVPELDACWTYESPWMKATVPRPDSRADRAMIDRLRSAEFDAAVIFTVYSQNPLASAFLCYLAEIPLRLAHCRENPYHLLTHWVVDPEPGTIIRHEVRRQLDLVATIGAGPSHERLSLRVPAAARQRVRERLRGLGVEPGSSWAVIHPGASAPSRRYAPEGFAEAARRLVLELGWPVVFTGDASERPLVESIRARMAAPAHSLAGELSLAELAALIECAPLLIANNTGPVHIAAAVGTPVVDLYALTNPQHTPWAVPNRVLNHDVPCKPCYKSVCPEGHHDCLRLVPPGAIVQAAVELIAPSGRPGEGRRRGRPQAEPAGSVRD